MSSPASRRGFLRDLVGLPLVGGGLTLIGAPVAVAEPVTPRLAREYANWLAFEHYNAQMAAYGTMDRHWYSLYGSAYRWHKGEPGDVMGRAALVLSTVGCNWREGGL